MRGRGGDFPALFFQRGLRGLGCRLGRRWTVATGDHRPFVSPRKGKGPLATPLRGGAPVSAPASVGPGRCPPGTRTPLEPPKGSLVLDLLQKGFPKNNTRLRLPLPARLCRATVSPAGSVGRWATCHRHVAAPTGGGKSRLPLWGSCHGIAVTERGEPGTYSRPQPKIPERPLWRDFLVLSGHRPSPAPAPGSGSRRGAAGGWARRRGSRRAAPGPPGA